MTPNAHSFPDAVATETVQRYYPGAVEAEQVVSGVTMRLYRFDRPDGLVHIPANEGDHGLTLGVRGTARIECRTEGEWERGRIEPGHTSIEPALLQQSWRWDRDHAVFVLYLPDAVLRRGAEEAGHDPARIALRRRADAGDPLLRHVLGALMTTGRQDRLDRLFTETSTTLLAAHLLRHHCEFAHAVGGFRGGLARHRLKRVEAYVRAHLDEDVRLADLAAEAGYSAYHFCRAFKEETGESPYQYVVRLRMEEAGRLLKETDWNVLQVALSVGYRSPSHFTQVFKRQVGTTPTLFRRGN